MSSVSSCWDNQDLRHKAYEAQNLITNAQNIIDQGEVTYFHRKNVKPS
jgi:hypothetical protein